MKRKTFRDSLALIYGGAILLMWLSVFGLWAMERLGDNMPSAVAMVLGASISEFARIAQFYFRKSGPDTSRSPRSPQATQATLPTASPPDIDTTKTKC